MRHTVLNSLIAAVLGVLFLGAGLANATTTGFTVNVPRIGSTTAPQNYITSTEFRDINVRLTSNPHDVWVKAVRCDGGGSISSAKLFRANDHNVRVIAADVRDNTCFKLNFDAPTLRSVTIVGRVSA